MARLRRQARIIARTLRLSEAELAQLEASLGDETGGSSVPQSATSLPKATPSTDELEGGGTNEGAEDAKSAEILPRLPALQWKPSNPLSELAEAAFASSSAKP